MNNLLSYLDDAAVRQKINRNDKYLLDQLFVLKSVVPFILAHMFQFSRYTRCAMFWGSCFARLRGSTLAQPHNLNGTLRITNFKARFQEQ